MNVAIWPRKTYVNGYPLRIAQPRLTTRLCTAQLGRKACLDFEIQTNHSLLTGRPDLVAVKSKKKIRVFISFYIYNVVCWNKRGSFSYMFSFSCLLLPAPVFCGT